jgi:hypothetical protein
MPGAPVQATRRWGRSVVLVAIAALMAVGALPGVATAAPAPDRTGFSQPYAGDPRYRRFTPTIAQRAAQVNEPLGQERADRLAMKLGFDKSKALSRKQFALFISGRGKGGGTPEAREAAYLADSSARYLSNSTATRMYRNIDGVPTRILLGSYGLIVMKDGLLMSPANDSSPVLIINWVLAPEPVCRFLPTPPTNVPCGYMGKWMRKNGARDTLRELYASAYPRQAPFGSMSQQKAVPHELVANRRPDGSTVTVGMSMVPGIWVVNFLLVYALNPELAAKMPAYWTPIPAEVAEAIYASPNGQVPYRDYMKYFPE